MLQLFGRNVRRLEDYLEDCNPPEKRTEYETTYNTLRKEGLSAISKEDAVWIEHIVQKLNQLNFKCQFCDSRLLASSIKDLIKRAQDKAQLHHALPDLINRAQEAIAKSEVKEMQEVLYALYPFTEEEGKPQVRFMKSGITL